MTSRAALGLLALAATFVAGWYWYFEYSRPGVPLDDAFMFLRYADHWLEGHGHAWNPGEEQAYGSTSMLYFFAVLGMRAWSGLVDVALLRSLSFAFGLGTAVVLVVAGWRSLRAARLPGALALATLVIVPFLLCHPIFLYQCRGGMDTTLAMLTIALVAASTLWVVRQGTRTALATLVVCSFLAYEARPDNLLMAGLTPALALLVAAERGRRWRLLLVFGGGLGALLGADALVKTLVFGVPLPLSVYAKAQGYEGYTGAPRWNTVLFLFEYLGLALPFLVVLILCTGKRSGALVLCCLVPALLTMAVLFQMNQVMGYKARFFVPTLPMVILAAVLALQGALQSMRDGTGSPRGLPLRVAAAFVLVALHPPGQELLTAWYSGVLKSRSTVEEITEPSGLPEISYKQCVQKMGSLASNLPAGSILSMSEYGAVGAEAPEVVILDPLGLHDREVARHGFSAERLLARQPELIWMPHTDYTVMHRDLKQALLESGDYAYYPGAFLYGVAVRKTGPRAEEVQTRFARLWKRAYPGYPMENARRDG